MRPVWRALAALPYYYSASPPVTARAAHSSGLGMSGAREGGAGALPAGAAAAEAAGAPPGTCLIGYVTDIEGNRAYFDEYVRISRVLDRDAASSRLQLREGCELVFGGDVCDKGDADLHVARELVELKRRYPARVHIILGNRDVNKIRWAHELGRTDLERLAAGANADDEGGGGGTECVAWWSDVRPRVRDDAARARWMLRHTMGSAVPDTFELRRSELARAAAEREGARADAPQLEVQAPAEGGARVFSLGALLSGVFGVGGGGPSSPSAAPDGGGPAQPPPAPPVDGALGAVSDEAVVASFRESVLPGGPMFELLAAGQVGAVLGDCLFVHGALSARNLGQLPPRQGEVPPRDASGRGFVRAQGLAQWVAGINAFAAQEVASFARFPTGEPGRVPWAEEGGYGGRGGEGLVQYGMGALPLRQQQGKGGEEGAEGKGEKGAPRRPRSHHNPSAIYASWFEHGAPLPIPAEVASFVTSAGVSTVLVGHQPIGDTVAVLTAQAESGGSAGAELRVVCADMSYSNHVKWVEPSGGTDGPPQPDQTQPAPPALAPRAQRAAREGGGEGQVVPGGGNRGVAVCEVLIEMDCRMRHAADACAARSLVGRGGLRPTIVRMHGCLSDGR